MNLESHLCLGVVEIVVVVSFAVSTAVMFIVSIGKKVSLKIK